MRPFIFQIKKFILNTANLFLNKFGFKLERIDASKYLNNFYDIKQYFDLLKNEEKRSYHKFGKSKKNKLTINWILPYIGKGGGGIMTIMRFVKYFSEKGYLNRVYTAGNKFAVRDTMTKRFIQENYINIDKNFEVYSGSLNIKKSDILISTSWETAYYALSVKNTALKAYFIQDFEPYFQEMSVRYKLAEKTYKMGYYGVFAGKWLQNRIEEKYHMKGVSFDLGVDHAVYKDLNLTRKKQVAVYIRTFTKRRGSTFLFAVLEELYKRRPDIKIVTFGDDLSPYKLPFEFDSYGIINSKQLVNLYNKSCLGLIISLTNYSLVPQEMMACGLPVIDIDEANNRSVYPTKNNVIILEKLDVYKWVDRIIEIIDNKKLQEKIRVNALKYVKEKKWDNAFEKVENALIKKLFE